MKRVLIHKSLLKYEFHKKPHYDFTKFWWGTSRELKFLKFRIELKLFNGRKINDD